MTALDTRHLARCSPELREMFAAVETWGRARWPEARVISELAIPDGRLDMAFVLPSHLVGVEMKSAKDKIDGLADQLKAYRRVVPEVWLCFASRWVGKAKAPSGVGELLFRDDQLPRKVVSTFARPPSTYEWSNPSSINHTMTAPMLRLLWAAEARAMAQQHGLSVNSRSTLTELIPRLARKLTGDEIVNGVCKAIRSRETRWPADPALPFTSEWRLRDGDLAKP